LASKEVTRKAAIASPKAISVIPSVVEESLTISLKEKI
jgi:hypothetical protein